MNEKLYLFNPFNIKKWTDEEISQQIDMLNEKYNNDANTLYEYALNVENLANQMYIIGEMKSRFYEKKTVLKAEVTNEENLQVYKQRDVWEETHEGKVPAMSYFQSMASDFVKDKRIILAQDEADYIRWSTAYESIEAKMNAVKKKMEAVKYEEFGS